MPPLQFQRVCDKGKYTCNTKGGHKAFAGTELHVCSNHLPNQWWSEKTKFDEGAIFRRITVVHWHYAYKKYRLYRSTGEDPSNPAGWAMTKFMAAYRLENPIYVHPINVIH